MNSLTGIASVLTALSPHQQAVPVSTCEATLSLFEAARPKKYIDAAAVTGWKADLIGRFSRLRSFNAGWAGVDSKAICPISIFRASRALDIAFEGNSQPVLPSIVPVADGGLQLEWHTPEYDFEIYFGPDDSVTAIWEDRTSGVETEKDGNAAIDLLFSSICRLAPRPGNASNAAAPPHGPVLAFAT